MSHDRNILQFAVEVKRVCRVLGLTNETQALARLDDDERYGYVLHTHKGDRETIIINEKVEKGGGSSIATPFGEQSDELGL